MARLFVIGIGGTGSRVIKSLMFLLAAGVEINASEIIPIIIDVDLTNGDFNRTEDILKNYQNIRNHLGTEFKHNRFFSTAVTTLPQLDGFKLSLENVGSDNKFKDYIDYRSLDSANKSLVDAFFSEKNLETTLEVGFEGNPNMGSVVLNQFKDSKGFEHFASDFEEEDRVFVIGSIFGGTGAAGLPLLIKNIRGADEDIPNHDRLSKAKIGALIALPYFGVMPDKNSPIEKSTFISKTKAALMYYRDNINKDINALYYIGDQNSKDYENNKGAMAQKNAAHFVELASALAIVDFMSTEDKNLSGLFKEFGVKNNPQAGVINFTDLGLVTEGMLAKSLTQYKYFTLFLQQRLLRSIHEGQDFCKKGQIKIDKSLIEMPYYRDYVTKFNESFNEWLNELAGNTVAFAPFREVSEKNIFQLINGYEPKKSFSFKNNYDVFIECLNDAESKVTEYPIEEKFMSIFYLATLTMINKKFVINSMNPKN